MSQGKIRMSQCFKCWVSKFLNLFVTAIFNHFVNAIINYCLPILNSIFNLRFPNLIPEWGIIELIGCFVSLYHIYEIISYCISLKLIIPLQNLNKKKTKQTKNKWRNSKGNEEICRTEGWIRQGRKNISSQIVRKAFLHCELNS